MHKTRIPSPARSESAFTPRRKTRSTRSVGSPAHSNASGRLTSIVDQFKETNWECIPPSPLNKTVLSDNTEIEQPRRQSWWKRVNHSKNMNDFIAVEKAMEPNNILDDLEVEVLSPERKNYLLDLPESSGSESVSSIVIPQRKLFTQKENVPNDIFKQIQISRKSMTKQNKTNDKTVNIGTKTLFGRREKRSRPQFPDALLNFSPEKTANQTKDTGIEVKTQPRSLFGNRQGTKRKNIFADFIASESEDEISEIQPKLFAFQRNTNPVRHSTASRRSRGNRESSPASSLTADIEMDDWKMLPSSTMVEHQLDALAASTPEKKLRLSKLSETKESDAGTASINTLSNKSTSKRKSKTTLDRTAKEPELSKAVVTNQIELKSTEYTEKVETTNEEEISPANKSKLSLSKLNNKTFIEKEVVIDKDGTTIKINNQTQVLNKMESRSLTVINEKSRDVINIQSEADSRIINNQTYKINNNTAKTDQDNNDDLNITKNSQLVEEEKIKNEKKLQLKDTEVQIIPTDKGHDEAEKEVQVETKREEKVEADKEVLIENERETQIENEEVELHLIEENEEEAHLVYDDEEIQIEVEREKVKRVQDKAEIQAEEEVQIEEENEVQVDYENEVQVEEEEEVQVEDENKVQVDDEEVHIEDENEVQVEDEEVHIEDENDVQVEEEEVHVEDEHEVQVEDKELPDEDEEVSNKDEEEVQVADEEVLQVDADEKVDEDDEELQIEEDEEVQVEDADQEEAVDVEDDEVEDMNKNENVIESDQLLTESEVENEEEDDQYEEDRDVDVDTEQDIEIEEDVQADVLESEQEETGEINVTQELEAATSNATHNTIGRHPQKNVQSPEDILHNMSNHDVSFIAKGRNTSMRKTLLINFTVRQSEAPLTESTGLDDGTKNSSAEGSGWDSHRTTRKTLRQTFGKDFTPRKSLRALVMEKSAKRQTAINEANAKLHQANSTEIPNVECDYNDMAEESDHEVSRRTRQTTLEMYLQKVKNDIMETKRKIEADVKNSTKPNPVNLHLQNRVPHKGFRKPNMKPMAPKAPKAKRTKPNIVPLEHLPEDFINDLKYKPPKRFRPSNASWLTKRLYKFLETKLEPKYDYKARLRAEKLAETIYEFTRQVRKQRVAPPHAVAELKHEMARLDVVNTHYEFYDFIRDYMPYEVKIKVVPDILNNIPLPSDGLFSSIIA